MINFRVATPQDGEAFAKIYEPYVRKTAITFEYIPPDGEEFARRIAAKSEKYPFLALEEDGQVIGYAYASEFRTRAAYAWDAELSVYLAESCCGRGLGTRCYAALEALLKRQGFVNLYGLVTDPNPPSVALHEKCGFREVGRLSASGYKLGKWWGLLYFEKQIAPLAVPPREIIPFSALEKEEVTDILKQI